MGAGVVVGCVGRGVWRGNGRGVGLVVWRGDGRGVGLLVWRIDFFVYIVVTLKVLFLLLPSPVPRLFSSSLCFLFVCLSICVYVSV